MPESPYRGLHAKLSQHPLLRAQQQQQQQKQQLQKQTQALPPTPTDKTALLQSSLTEKQLSRPLEKSLFNETLKFRVANGDYMASKKLCEQQESAIDTAKAQYQSALSEAQELEAQRLRDARELALRRARTQYEAQLRELQDRFEEKQREAQLVHDEKLALFESLQWQRALAKPAVLSTFTNSIRQAEAHLAKLRQFDEAAAAQSLFEKRERHELHRMEIERSRKLAALVETKRQQYLEEERTYMGKLKNELNVAKQRAAEELRRIEATYAHLEHDMRHAHGRQRLMSARCGVRSGSTMTEGAAAAVGRGSGTSSPTEISTASIHSATTTTTTTAAAPLGGKVPTAGLLERFDSGHRAQRGTMMLRRLQGDRFVIPSLCDMYGSALGGGGMGGNGKERSGRSSPVSVCTF